MSYVVHSGRDISFVKNDQEELEPSAKKVVSGLHILSSFETKRIGNLEHLLMCIIEVESTKSDY